MISTVPPEFTRLPSAAGYTSGRLDRATAVTEARNETGDSGQALVRAHFVGGAQQVWATANQQVYLTMSLFQFDSEATAAQFKAAQSTNTDSEIHAQGDGPYTTFDVPLPGASSFSAKLGLTAFAIVLFAKKTFVVQEILTAAKLDPQLGKLLTALAAKFATDQNARLPN